MLQRFKPLIWPAFFTVLVCALLVSLGLWQLRRLAWKEALIARIEQRTKAPASPLPRLADWPHLDPEAYEYRHVALIGSFDHMEEALIFRGTGGGTTGLRQPGYLVLTPFRLSSGGTVIINRGFVPLDRKDPSQRVEGQIVGEQHLTGLMRAPEPRNLFTPADDPAKGQYFTRDPGLIAAHFGLTQAAPFTIDLDDVPVPGGWLKAGTTEIAFPNNHLSYALTWFGLAAALLGVFTAFAWRKLREWHKPCSSTAST